MPVKVGLVQISEQRVYHYFFPYSVGLLQAYVEKHASQPERYEFEMPIYSRVSIPEAIDTLKGLNVAGFSTYVWNERRHLAIAEALKRQYPHILIIFGGPQVPDRAETFLRAHPFIDVCSHGEGESLFLALLECFPERNWQDIPGLSYLKDGLFNHNPPGPRRKDIDQIPSPYLSGVFDRIMAAKPENMWIGVWETNRGCPFSCTFCDWGSAIQSKVYSFEIERVKAEIEWFGRNKVPDIFTADANFGILKRDVELAAHMASVKKQYGFPRNLQTQTAKNASERVFQINKILAEAGLGAIAAISLQSVDPHTLKAIKRDNISLDAYRDVQQRCLQEGIYSYTDIIMGLPGETYQGFSEGLASIMANGQHNKILYHDASLLPNAEMAQPEYRKAYGIETTLMMIPSQAPAPDGIHEYLEIVSATKDLPAEDWVKAHVFAWMSGFLFYTHKFMQLTLMLLHQQAGLSYKTLIEALMDAPAQYPTLQYARFLLESSAQQLQMGASGFAEKSLVFSLFDGMYLSADVNLQLTLAMESRFDHYYQEAAQVFQTLVQEKAPSFPIKLLLQSLGLNRAYFMQAFYHKGMPIKMPIPHEAIRFQLDWNLGDYFQGQLFGTPVPLKQEISYFYFEINAERAFLTKIPTPTAV